MNVGIYTCIYLCICTHIYTNTCMCIYIYIYMRIYICIYTYIYTDTYMYVHIFTYTCKYIHGYLYIYSLRTGRFLQTVTARTTPSCTHTSWYTRPFPPFFPFFPYIHDPTLMTLGVIFYFFCSLHSLFFSALVPLGTFFHFFSFFSPPTRLPSCAHSSQRECCCFCFLYSLPLPALVPRVNCIDTCMMFSCLHVHVCASMSVFYLCLCFCLCLRLCIHVRLCACGYLRGRARTYTCTCTCTRVRARVKPNCVSTDTISFSLATRTGYVCVHVCELCARVWMWAHLQHAAWLDTHEFQIHECHSFALPADKRKTLISKTFLKIVGCVA